MGEYMIIADHAVAIRLSIIANVAFEGAAWNETYWANKRFNELLKIGRAELDEKKRAQIYGEIIMAFAADLHTASSKLHKPDKIAANWEFDGFKIGERWSFV